jgi:membrane-bound ClpP family serine protease
VRIFGIILAVLGALVLGYCGFTYAVREKAAGMPGVYGGIVLVVGLIMVAISGKRETA